ncbi:Phosphodiesterase I [Rasamsonia emersonii CBS 393.64]|uniref:5'-3' exoribonuclease 1 n=1 Tax=Rasamsonia emersonii (strain ATCC 16479 / CBS 393.64 / IMI 116815) TaxID=1408163 RepID=A0A0F4YPA7_RASE3|nr:Phosphodiesterase I [Rasamsonia emersonii CBS 393.64]KKA20107.1 Phosphodiesterase I [Rasamsonia emersonii CBS 393.64]
MGVPKFFRWLSERYPAISQLIAENRIPEFDCLYLDMNGIIHNCTHKDTDSPTFRMTEDQMFIAIFNYVEHLYGKIKPKKLFFMAVDGVAPRAKMNQQRARRFRTALDAEVAKEKAIAQGIEMPKEDPFDSNCITPGTEFMAKLTKQLKYFINKKVSEDTDWQGVDIVLSGHEVPGEGEHKIMEYIRQKKAQPGYDPNVRHCLYGLDADLIMLGLLSHDPHFCLLREEVTFGRPNQKKTKELEHQNFYLLHLCMVREYLELEFQELKEKEMGFPFDMERVIDDFILMAFFVGNDFLPNLPRLHINEGALAVMFKIYKDTLPKMGGYMNEKGTINLERLGILLDALTDVEFRFFEAEYSDAKWIRAKRNGVETLELPENQKTFTITPAQKEILKEVKKYVLNRPENVRDSKPLDLPSTLPARDRKFVEQLADDLRLRWTTIEDEHGDRFIRLQLPAAANAGGNSEGSNEEDEEEEEEEDEEASMALHRVIKKYENAKVQEFSAEEARAAAEEKYEKKFQQWKNKYYEEKFGFSLDNEEEMKKLTENYVQGLQWVLYYYYRGIVSWPWFFRYHYSPMISDVKKGLGADMNFKLGQPFRPFQQLMGVLPDRSKQIVPPAYRDLMTSPESPIIDFYPHGMGGGGKDSVIDEKRLLSAMATRDHLLTPEERERNEFGVTLKFTYSPDIEFTYPSSLPGIFPDIPHCHCIENIFDLPTMEGLEPFIGLVEGVKLGAAALAGFPSLKTLPHAGQLAFHGVNVFQQDSRNESMIVTILESEKRSSIELAKEKLGKRVYVGWPFLQEALVVRVSDELFDYVLPEGEQNVVSIPHSQQQIEQWHKKAERIEGYYSKRLGMIIGPVESMVHVHMLKGLRKTDEGATVKEFAEIPGQETDYALQLIVDHVISEDERFIEREALPIEEEFPEGSRAFFLGEYNYGRPVHVIGHEKGKVNGLIASVKGKEPEFGKLHAKAAEKLSPYIPSFAIAKSLQLNPLVLAKITSSFSVMVNNQRVNLGLNLKFEARKQKVLGYSRRGESGWEFSQKAIDLVQQYMIRFPDFIAGIQRNPQGDRYEPTDFYPEEIAMQKIKEIREWLKSIEAKSFERVPLDAEQLDSDIVKLIEQDADRLVQSQPPPEAKKIKGVPRGALLKPSDVEQRLGNQKFALGDRVVYAQDSGKVPIATRGTVVGLTRTPRTVLLDVVFDVSFMSGTTLGDRCSPFRGSTVPVSSVLNLTNKQLVVSTRAAAEQQAQKQKTPLTIQGYGTPLGPGGQGQLREARPPPPLKGTFRGALAGQQNGVSRGTGAPRGPRGGRGAVNGASLPVRPHPNGTGQPNHAGKQNQDGQPNHTGQSNHTRQPSDDSHPRGGRGRGGPARGQRGGRGGQAYTRGGYIALEKGDPEEGVVKNNPNFKPQNYSNVPPPPNLNRGSIRGGRAGGGRGAPRGNALRGGRGVHRGRGAAVAS